MAPATNVVRNHLLSSLGAAERAVMTPSLELVLLPVKTVLEVPNKPIPYVYFFESGLGSVVAETPGGRKVEVGLIGSDGMTGAAVVMGDDRTSYTTFIQVGGRGYRVPVAKLRAAMAESAGMRSHFLRFVQAFGTQVTHTALANAKATIEERLARWLLMSHDRAESDELPLTHEFLALMLGVRRAGVTIALKQLKERGVIAMSRGGVLVRDRDGLRDVAGDIYGVPEKEYARLTGWRGRAWRARQR